MRKFTYTVTKEDFENKEQIKDLLRHNFSFSSRLRTKIKKAKSVYLNGEQIKPWIVANQGDILTVVIPEEKSRFSPENIPIDPVFEDDDFLIINKPAGFVVHPTKGHPMHTIANGVMQYMIDTNQSFKIRFINRLDMDTSGLLALGKNSHAQDEFVKQMKENSVHKGYIAVVKGLVQDDHGTIDLPIGHPDEGSVKRGVSPDGSPSITHYHVVERYPRGYSLVRLELETGRTHQIRVHMAHIGHPVVGDHLYGEEVPYLIERQALHAERLSFDHPDTNEPLNLVAPMPNDMQELIKKLK